MYKSCPDNDKPTLKGGIHGLRKKIESVMGREEGSGPHSFLKNLLSVVSLVYTVAATLRALVYSTAIIRSKRLPCAVISVGNLTVGGTGKTPLTIYVARLLRQWGYQVAVVSRGYRGAKERSEGVVSDGRQMRMGVEDAGDEPYLMACKLGDVPVLVGRNRFLAGTLAVRNFKPDVLVLDDGFQHMQLHRDLDLVLLDNARPFGNGCLLPRGILREPVIQMKRADAFILTRSDGVEMSQADRSVFHVQAKGKPMFSCRHVPDGLREGICLSSVPRGCEAAASYDPQMLKGRRILAFSGIVRNDDFRALLQAMGGHVVAFLAFPDHHAYCDEDMDNIARLSKRYAVDLVVTSEKDFVRIAHRLPSSLSILVLGIEISFGDDEERFHRFLKERIGRISKRPARGAEEQKSVST